MLRPKTLSREKHGTLADMIAHFKAEMKNADRKKLEKEAGINSSGSFILAKTITETDGLGDNLGRTQPKTLKPSKDNKTNPNLNVRKKLVYLDASIDSGGGLANGIQLGKTSPGVLDEKGADRNQHSRSHSAGRNRVNIPSKSPDKKLKKKTVPAKVKSRAASKDEKADKPRDKDKSKCLKLPSFIAPATQTKVFNKKSSRTNMKTDPKTKNQSDGNILKNAKLLNPLKSTLEKDYCRGLLKSSKFRDGLNSVESVPKNHDDFEKSSTGNCGVSQNQGDRSLHGYGTGLATKKLDEGRIFSNASIKDSDKVESTKEEMKPGVKLSDIVGGKSEAAMSLSKPTKVVEDLMQRLVKQKFAKQG